MRVSISKNRSCLDSGDRYYVLNRDYFNEYVDKEDFNCRKSLSIEQAYHKNWFEVENKFLPPILFFYNGKLQFINGRHRTALLFEFLSEIPVIFLSPDAKLRITDDEVRFNLGLLNKIAKPMESAQCFEFPDFAIKDLG
ncbi:hypothetical protein [Paraglaciecola marina]|uniref:hypothetical protein n=1 Tax=Paraglaciecola marina TaxID=2500157 RepID=UPI00105E4C58|nr:hypothetical protein [Paraglaciecola marina]